MSKTSGLGAAISVADASSAPQVITNDVTEFSMATPRAAQDTTGVDKFAHERLLLLADVTFSLKGVFNPAVNMSHAVLSSMSSTTVNRATQVTPTASSHPFLGANCVVTTYDVNRGNDGALTWSSELMLADGATPTWTNS